MIRQSAHRKSVFRDRSNLSGSHCIPSAAFPLNVKKKPLYVNLSKSISQSHETWTNRLGHPALVSTYLFSVSRSIQEIVEATEI